MNRLPRGTGEWSTFTPRHVMLRQVFPAGWKVGFWKKIIYFSW
jgi:hypothetical protein